MELNAESLSRKRATPERRESSQKSDGGGKDGEAKAWFEQRPKGEKAETLKARKS